MKQLDTTTQLGALEDSIRNVEAETGSREVDYSYLIDNGNIHPGMLLRIYRLADRDVAKDKAAFTNLVVTGLTECGEGLFFVSGEYRGSTTQQINEQAIAVRPDGTIQVNLDNGTAAVVLHKDHNGLIYVEDRVLKADVELEAETTIPDGIAERQRQLVLNGSKELE
jgi:hypothetical protein